MHFLPLLEKGGECERVQHSREFERLYCIRKFFQSLPTSLFQREEKYSSNLDSILYAKNIFRLRSDNPG